MVERRIKYYFRDATGKTRFAFSPKPDSGESISTIGVIEWVGKRPDFSSQRTVTFDDAKQTAYITKGSAQLQEVASIYSQAQAIQLACAELEQTGMYSPSEVEQIRSAKFAEEIDKILPRRNAFQKIAMAVRRVGLYMDSNSARKRHTTRGPRVSRAK